MTAIERDNPELREVPPKDYARPALDKQRLRQLIDMIGNIRVGNAEARSRDVLVRVYEYFLSQFASAEGRRRGRTRFPQSNRQLVLLALALVAIPGCGDAPTDPLPPMATTIAVSPSSAVLFAFGDTSRFTATVRDQYGQVMEGAAVTYASSDEAVATVDSSGLVTAVGNGNATMTATSGTAAGSAAVTVEQVVAEVIVSPDSVKLSAIGDTVRLAAEGLDANGHAVATAGFEWFTQDSVATVDGSGLVTAVRNGNATVTATSAAAQGSGLVTVEQVVAEVIVSPDSVTLFVIGDTVQLVASALDANGYAVAEARIGWSSIDPAVATVDTTGMVTAVGVGVVEVQATSSGSASGLAIVRVSAAAADREALIAFFAATDGPNWSYSSLNWGTGAPLGDWYGVTTDDEGRVTHLALADNDVTGLIPPEVGSLTELTYLDFRSNALTGPIPPELFNLVNLKSLYLSGNQLTETIPGGIGTLTNLTYLYLEANRFTGSIPPELGNLANLQILYLYGNELTGVLPSSLLSLERLSLFRFEDNDGLCVPGTSAFENWLEGIGGAAPEAFCNVSDVDVLASFFQAVGGTEWHRSDGWLQGHALAEWHGVGTDSLGRVETLDMSGNGLTGRVPSGLGELGQLTSLRIGDNALSGPLPVSLARLSLRELHYDGTKLCASDAGRFRAWLNAIPSHRGTGHACETLSDREILTAFYEAAGGPQWDDNNNWLTDAPLNKWRGIVADSQDRVQQIWLTANGLTGHIAPELGGLERLTQLYLGPGYIYSYGCTRSGRPQSGTGRERTTLWSAPTERVGYRDTRHEMWSNNDSTGMIVETGSSFEPPMRPAPDLSEQSQPGRRNRLTGRIPAELGNLASLETVNLVGNELSGPIPPELGNLVNLRSLGLGLNELSGAIPPELGSLANLERLDLPANELSGPIPPDLGHLTSLGHLNFERNKLSGWIPPELGNLANLEILAIGGNELSGPIPGELANLFNLQQLQLAINRLEGPIPPELGSLAKLLSLSLYCTSVTGSIPPTLGQLRELEYLNLFGNKLSGEIPQQLGQLPRIQYLSLSHNYELTGRIPAEFGRLTELRGLAIGSTRLLGPIPEELGRLANLETLWLGFNQLEGELPAALGNLWSLGSLLVGGNPQLAGPIPREIARAPLQTFWWHRTGLCAPRDRGFQAWLAGLESHHGEGKCTLVPREIFSAFYDATGGSGWASKTNWLSEVPVSSWFGVTVEDSLVTALELPGNGLSGTLPPEVGDFGDLRHLDLARNALTGVLPGDLGNLTELEALDLSSNRFSGPVPHELVRLGELKSLDIGGNELQGALPGGISQLEALLDFNWEDSGACAPEVAWFQEWLESIGRRSGPTCDGPFALSVAAAHLTQAAQGLAGAVPLVAGRPALLRVFATADRANGYQPDAHATFHLGGREVRVVDMQLASSRGVPDHLDPERPGHSYQALIPAAALRPGVELVVDVDPDSVMPRAELSEMRVALDVREMPSMQLTVVPVLAESGAGGDVRNWVRDADDPPVEFMRAVLPVGDLDLTVREPLSIANLPAAADFDAWLDLLQDIDLLRTMEGGSGYWYAVVQREGDRGIAGIAYIEGRTSVGIPDSEVFAHEVGHSMSLAHAPCGRPARLDPDYPYRDGSIGVQGYDPRGDTLVDPSTPDLMSYCHPQWISDHNFKKALEYRLEEETATPARAARDLLPGNRLLLWGGVDAEGQLRLVPAFALEAPAKLPSGSGPYRIEGFARDGASEFALDFGMDEVSEGGGGFLFTIPFEEERLASLERIVLSGPEGSTALERETPAPPMAIVIDQETGRIRSILRGEAAEDVAAAAAADAPPGQTPLSRVLVSYGLPGQPSR